MCFCLSSVHSNGLRWLRGQKYKLRQNIKAHQAEFCKRMLVMQLQTIAGNDMDDNMAVNYM